MAEDKRGLPRGEKADRYFEDLSTKEMKAVQGAGMLTVNKALQSIAMSTPVRRKQKNTSERREKYDI